jgi:hypothetical protein
VSTLAWEMSCKSEYHHRNESKNNQGSGISDTRNFIATQTLSKIHLIKLNQAMKFAVVCMFMIMMSSQSQAQCWQADPDNPTSFTLASSKPNCLDNAQIPRNATEMHIFYNITILLNFVPQCLLR